MIQLFEYELPFRSPFLTGASRFQNRNGILLHYQEDETDFIVEASPLPGFSRESFSEVKQILLNQKRFIEQFLSQKLSKKKIQNLTELKPLYPPSIQFSLSFIALSILAYRQKKTIYDLFDQKKPDLISINDVIGHGPLDTMKDQIEASIKKGFRVIKIKAPHPIGKLSELLNSIQIDHPDIKFRIDANQSWPKSKIEHNCEKLQNVSVEYLEEPCKMESLSEIEDLQKKSSLPLAIDESISTIEELQEILDQFPDLVVIIKPMLIGNFLEIHETISQYRSCFKQIVVTTSLESKIGRSMIASTASLIGDQQMSHGLHTGHLFADDLLPDFDIEKGSIINLRENPAIQSFSQIQTSFLKNLG